MECKIRDFKVLELPQPKGVPNARYYVPNGTGTDIDEYLTDLNGNYRKVSSSAISAYTHDQGVASDTWNITHNLGFYPSITIVDSSGRVVEGEEQFLTLDTIQISFNGAFSGKAYLS